MAIAYGSSRLWAWVRRNPYLLIAILGMIAVMLLLGPPEQMGPVGIGAVIVGQRFSYSDTVNEWVDISEALDTLSPTDTPLLQLIGRDSLRDRPEAVKHEWPEHSLRGQYGNDTGGTLNNTTNPVTATLVSGDGAKFRESDIVRITSSTGSEEICRITAVSVGSDTITLVRGWGSSSPVAHASGATVTIVASALPQGSDVGEARTGVITTAYNYTQIFEEVVKVSATDQAVRHRTRASDPAFLIAEQMEILGTNMEKAILFGVKAAPAASSPGTMGGLREFITTNVVDKATAALTQTALEDALETVWRVGGKAPVIVTNSTQKRRINSFYDPLRQGTMDDTTLRGTVNRIETDFGDARILMDRWMPNDEILIIDPSKIGFGPLRPLGVTKLPPKSREYDVWQMTGEYTAEVRLESTHVRIKGLATTGLF